MSEISGRIGGRRDDADHEEDPVTGDVTARAGRWLRRRQSGGVAVATVVLDGAYRGTTLSSWFVASVEPLQILVSVEDDNPWTDWVRSTGIFALSVLPWQEQFVADQFAGFTPRAGAKFGGMDHMLAPSGSPLAPNCIAWADCTLAETFETGDHLCVLGAVQSLGRGNGDESDPLVHYLSRYRRCRQT